MTTAITCLTVLLLQVRRPRQEHPLQRRGQRGRQRAPHPRTEGGDTTPPRAPHAGGHRDQRR